MNFVKPFEKHSEPAHSKTVNAVFLIYLGISHILLPRFNQGKDFLLFSQWNLFSGRIYEQVIDITCDHGKTFLLRDHQGAMRDNNLNIEEVFYFLQTMRLDLIRERYLSQLIKVCGHSKIEMARLQGSLYEHFIIKEVRSSEMTDL